MGFALYTFQKLLLTKQVDDLQYKLSMLQKREQDMTSLSSTMGSFMQSTSGSLSSTSSTGSSVFNASTTNALNSSVESNKTFKEILTEASKAVTQEASQSDGNGSVWTQYKNLIQKTQSSLGSWGDVTPKELAQLETQVQSEQKNLETQLSAKNTELKSVESAEDTQIKNSAPKLSLS